MLLILSGARGFQGRFFEEFVFICLTPYEYYVKLPGLCMIYIVA